MARKRKKIKVKKFWLIVPVLLVIALFVFYQSARKSAGLFAGCEVQNLSGLFVDEKYGAIFEGDEIPYPVAKENDNVRVLGTASPSERWIEIDLSEQKLRAWDGNTLFLETLIATGLPWWPTPKGEFRVWIKLRYTRMEGGEGAYYYNLPNVPFVMFFEGSGIPSWKGYGLHGTYWHNSFGTPRSHGCVNLPTHIAERLFYWTTPEFVEGKWAVRATESNPGTRIIIHE